MGRIVWGVVAGLVLALGLWLGYKWGAGNKAELERQLAEIKATGEVAQRDLDATRKNLKDQLGQLAQEYEGRAVTLRAEYERQKSQLEANVASASSAAAKAQAQLRATELERQRVAAQLATATGASRSALERQQSQLDAQALALRQRAEGLECLDRVVPVEEVVKVLNQAVR